MAKFHKPTWLLIMGVTLFIGTITLILTKVLTPATHPTHVLLMLIGDVGAGVCLGLGLTTQHRK